MYASTSSKAGASKAPVRCILSQGDSGALPKKSELRTGNGTAGKEKARDTYVRS